MNRLVLAIAATLAAWPTLAAQTAPNACGLLTDAEVERLIARGKQTYGQTADATPVVGGQGSVCDYPAGGQVAIYVGPNSTQAFEQFMKAWKQEQTLDKTTANALRVLEFAGRGDVPVAAGADRPLVRDAQVAEHVHGETGLDGPDLPPPAGAPVAEHAVDFLAARIRAAGRPVTLIPTGPLTNVALALARYPDLDIERIVLMGGAIAEGNITPAAEFNIWVDPEAAARVFASGIDVTMVGLDVTHRALMTPEHAERLRAAGRVGTMVAELWAFYHRYHARVYDFPGTPVHDALAVAHVIRGDLVRTERLNVEVDCASELCRGRTVVDLWRITGREPNAHVGVEVDGATFLDLLVERIGSLG